MVRVVLRLDFGLDDDPTDSIIDAIVESVFVEVVELGLSLVVLGAG